MTTCRCCHVQIWMHDFMWTDEDGCWRCWRTGNYHAPVPATPVEEQLGWLGVYAGPPQGWSR